MPSPPTWFRPTGVGRPGAAALAPAGVAALACVAGVATGVVTADYAAAAGAAVAALVVASMALLAHRVATASQQLTAARRTLAALSQTTHELLWRTDAEGRVTWASDAAYDVMGYRPDELVGRWVTDFLDQTAMPLWRRQIREFVRAGAGWQDVPQRFVHADGRTLLVETSARPMVGRRGAVIGYEGSVRPLSGAQADQERLAEQRLRVSSLLDVDALSIAFQPIVNLSTGTVVGVEALTRFEAEPHLPPDTWFARAWEVGLGVALELQSVRAVLAALPALPPDLYVSINAAPRTVLDPTFLELIHAESTPLSRLVIEITEHESIDDYGRLRSALVEARRKGLRLAVDDAGAGYASFRHIVKLRPDHIKLDRDLTAGIDEDPARRALASAVVVFALELDASVTAEGVETAAQLDILRSLSVDAAQGFYLCRPVADPAHWQTWSSWQVWLGGAAQAG